MLSALRISTVFAILFLILAIPGSTFAQQLRNKQLQPYFDFTTIQMPVEIVSIKLNGEEIQPGDNIMGDDDWLQGLSFTLKNISDKQIAYIEIWLQVPKPNGHLGYRLTYGVDFSRGESSKDSLPPLIQPGETVVIGLTKEKYPSFLYLLDKGGVSHSFETASYYIGRVSFEDEPDIIWEGGNLKRRDASQFNKFNVIERYVLPAKQN